MKRFVFVLFVAIWGLTMNACKETPQEPVETPPETVSAVDFDEVVIIRQVSLSQEDDEEVTITDSAVLAEISTLYTSMSLYDYIDEAFSSAVGK